MLQCDGLVMNFTPQDADTCLRVRPTPVGQPRGGCLPRALLRCSDGSVPGGRFLFEPTEARTREDSTSCADFGKCRNFINNRRSAVFIVKTDPKRYFLIWRYFSAVIHRLFYGRRFSVLGGIISAVMPRVPRYFSWRYRAPSQY